MRVRLIRAAGLAAVVLAALAPVSSAGGTGGAAIARTVAQRPDRAAANPAADAAVTRPQPAVPAVVPATLRFTGNTLDGKPFDAARLAGRPVILWFWAPWCAVCFGQAATVTELATKYDGRVSLVGVAGLDQSTAAMKQFVTQAEVGNVPHLDDRAGVLWKRFGIKEQSTFVMINRSGEVMLTGWQDSVTLAQWAAYLDQH